MTGRKQKTQKTRPKQGKPIDIPVPKRRDVMDALDRAAKPEKKHR